MSSVTSVFSENVAIAGNANPAITSATVSWKAKGGTPINVVVQTMLVAVGTRTGGESVGVATVYISGYRQEGIFHDTSWNKPNALSLNKVTQIDITVETDRQTWATATMLGFQLS